LSTEKEPKKQDKGNVLFFLPFSWSSMLAQVSHDNVLALVRQEIRIGGVDLIDIVGYQ
jgi:hypothetical protein